MNAGSRFARTVLNFCVGTADVRWRNLEYLGLSVAEANVVGDRVQLCNAFQRLKARSNGAMGFRDFLPADTWMVLMWYEPCCGT